MAIANQTLTLVNDLLGTLPGLAVRGAKLLDGCARIQISAAAAAIGALQSTSLGANVSLEPWHHPANVSPALPTEHLLVASTSPQESIEFGNLQLLGIHLVWHLHSTGALDAPRANDLLRAWHGVGIGA
jgi:hypothetical protein